MGYGHLFNGDASLDQEILAVLLGIWVVVSCRELIQVHLLSHINKLHESRDTHDDLNLRKKVFTVALGGVLAILLGALMFWIYQS